MASSSDPPRPDPRWDQMDEVVDAFEAAWAGGKPPRIADYLPKDGPWRRQVLIELVHADLEFRLKRGEAARVEGYLAAHRELGELPEIIPSLIRTEWAIRVRSEPDLSIRHYRDRFPSLGDELAQVVPAVSEPISPPAPAASGRDDGPLPRRLGKYELRQKVGQGHFGVVFRAWDTVLRREVAIKIPRPDVAASPVDVLNFLREARNTTNLRHPNVVAIYDAGTVDGTICLISEFIDGMTLAERLRLGPLGIDESVGLMVQILEALAHAHHRGIIHRDLKPSNILIDHAGTPHLADFGLAKRSTGDSTLSPLGASQVLIGTPAYMPPEQARGDSTRVDARSDVYGAGVLLFELLTGGVPFQGRGRLLQLQIEEADPPAPSRLNDEVKPDLEAICLRALAKQPDDRYQSASTMADDLANFRAGRPVAARTDGPPPLPFRQRHGRTLVRVALGLAIAVLLATLAYRWREMERRSVRDSALIKLLVQASIRDESLPFQGGADAGDEHVRLKAAVWAGRRSWLGALADRPELSGERDDLLLRWARENAARGDEAGARAAWADVVAALGSPACRQAPSGSHPLELAEALSGLGESEARAGRRAEGRVTLERAVSAWRNLERIARDRLGEAPNSPGARLDLAEALLARDRAARSANQGGAAEAVDEVEEVALDLQGCGTLGPDGRRRLGLIQLGLAERSRSFDLANRAAEWGRQACRTFDAGRDTDARDELLLGRAALLVGQAEADQNSATAYSSSGALTMFQTAARSFDRAIRDDPTNLASKGHLAAAEAGIAQIFVRSGRHPEALERYRRALDLLRSARDARPASHADLAASAAVRGSLARVEWDLGRWPRATAEVLLAMAEAQRATWLAPGEGKYRRVRDDQASTLARWFLPGRRVRHEWPPPTPGARHAEVELH